MEALSCSVDSYNVLMQLFTSTFGEQQPAFPEAKGDTKSEVEEFRKQLVPYSPPQAHVTCHPKSQR